MEKFNKKTISKDLVNIEKEQFYPSNCIELLKNFEEKEILPTGKKLNFSGVNNSDVYNISAPFNVGDTVVISGRVEKRETWANSQVMFFEEKNLSPIKDAPKLQLEDGFVASIYNELIVGGTEVYPNPIEDDPDCIGYRTAFYKGDDLYSLEKFTTGPEGMKDIRLVSLPNNKIGVFTRPQGGKNQEGKIGYIEIQSLEDLNAENILSAKIIENQFAPGEWGGANELHLLKDGRIGVLGHIAYRDSKGDRHYYAMSFIYDPNTHISTPIKIIATRKNFPDGYAKIPELSDVIFPGGLIRNGDGTATLYAGLSDAEAGSTVIEDPFEGL